MTDRDILRAAYQRVREHSDEEVHGLIDELETVALQYDKAFGRIKQAVSQPVIRVSNDPTEIEAYDDAYPPDSPKNERFHGLMCDVFDLRDKTR